MAIFGDSKFIQVLLGKIVRKNLEQPFLAILNIYQSFWEKLLEKNLEWSFLKRGRGPNWHPVIGKLLTLTNPNIMHCFIDTFSDP